MAQTPAAPVPSAASSDYRLGPGDVVEFKYFNNPELNDSMPIRPDGKVSLPLIGDLLLSGKTVMEVKNEIEKDYAPIVNRPSVNIVVRIFASQRVFVGGEVNRPSALPLLAEMTAQAAIFDAGGAKRTGSTSKVILIRRSDTGDAIRQIVDLNAKDSLPGSNFKLRPFDVLIVPETKIARVDRWVDEYLRQVIPIGLAGGFSYLFNPIQVHTP